MIQYNPSDCLPLGLLAFRRAPLPRQVHEVPRHAKLVTAAKHTLSVVKDLSLFIFGEGRQPGVHLAPIQKAQILQETVVL